MFDIVKSLYWYLMCGYKIKDLVIVFLGWGKVYIGEVDIGNKSVILIRWSVDFNC